MRHGASNPNWRGGEAGRLWAHVEKGGADHCWLWTGPVTKTGYGNMGAHQLAHRVSFRLAFGEFDPRMCVCHRCDTPLCVNPAHLFIGTRDDNNKDRDQKGRTKFAAPRGTANGTAKLHESDVLEIRRLIGVGCSQKSVAQHFGVSPSAVGLIHRRINWSWLS